jgi:hypothetical protein
MPNRPPRTKSPRHTAPPLLESLEARRLMSASLEDGVLQVRGTDEDDVIKITQPRSNPRRINVAINDDTFAFKAHRVRRIEVRAQDGDDEVSIGGRVRARAKLYGGRGDDTLAGGSAADLLVGGAGDDDLLGGRSKDRLFSGEGQDVFNSTDSIRELIDRDEDDGIRITLDEAPSLVRASVLDLLDGNDFRNLLRESDEGETVFELEWDAPGPHSAKINLTGEVIELEVEIDPTTLPAAVTASIAERYPDGEVTEAETLELPDTPLRYEVEVENDGLVRELVITPTGEILADDVEGPIEE